MKFIFVSVFVSSAALGSNKYIFVFLDISHQSKSF